MLTDYDAIVQRFENSVAYRGQLHIRQNRRSRDYELVCGYKRLDSDSASIGFFSLCNWNEPNESHVFRVIFGCVFFVLFFEA